MPTPETAARPPREYAVFLSYRHEDNKQIGRQWASWLHYSLETYEVPPDLIGTPNARGEPIPSSLYPIFRDEEELPAGADLTNEIRQALERSRTLVVLCSPRAVGSRFVADEIRNFKELGKSGHLLALMIDGEPNATDDPGKHTAGIPASAECLPEPLRFGVQRDDGRVDWAARAEPVCADVRPEGRPVQGWTTAAACRESLEREGTHAPNAIAARVQDYERRLEIAKLKIVAGALGVPLGILTQRDQEYRRRDAERRAAEEKVRREEAERLRAEAERQRARAEALAAEQAEQLRRISRSDHATAIDLICGGQRRKGVAYLGRALKSWPGNEVAALDLWGSVANPERDLLLLPIFSRAFSPTVICVAFSPDGSRMLTGHLDETARLWDMESGNQLLLLSGHSYCVLSVAFSPDGKRLFTGSDWNSSKLWDGESGRELFTLKGHSLAYDCAAFSPDGERLLTGSSDYSAKIWDVESGVVLHTLPHYSPVNSVAFSPDGQRVLTASYKTARLWHAENGTEMFTLETHSSEVTSVAFSPDGKRLLTGGGFAKLWDGESGKELFTFGGHTSSVHSVASVAFSPDGKYVLTSSRYAAGRERKLWDAESGKELLTLAGCSGIVSFSPDSELLLEFRGETLNYWDAKWRTTLLSSNRHSGRVKCITFSPDGKRVLSGDSKGTATLWDAKSGLQLHAFHVHSCWLNAIAYSPDGSRVVSGSDDKTAKLWDAERGKELHTLQGHSSRLKSVAFSPDGERLLTGSEDKWLPPDEVIPYITNPDPGMFEGPFGEVAKLWDAKTGKELISLHGHSGSIESVAFSPDGKRVLTGSSDTTAKVWDAESGKELFAFQAHFDWVTSATFSPDGQYALTASRDNTVKLWDAKSGKLLGTLLRCNDSVACIAVSPDGNRFASACWDDGGRIAHIPHSLGSPPVWLPDLIMAESAFEFTEEGLLREVPFEERLAARDRLPRSTGDNCGWDRLLQVLGR